MSRFYGSLCSAEFLSLERRIMRIVLKYCSLVMCEIAVCTRSSVIAEKPRVAGRFVLEMLTFIILIQGEHEE